MLRDAARPVEFSRRRSIIFIVLTLELDLGPNIPHALYLKQFEAKPSIMQSALTISPWCWMKTILFEVEFRFGFDKIQMLQKILSLVLITNMPQLNLLSIQKCLL